MKALNSSSPLELMRELGYMVSKLRCSYSSQCSAVGTGKAVGGRELMTSQEVLPVNRYLLSTKVGPFMTYGLAHSFNACRVFNRKWALFD